MNRMLIIAALSITILLCNISSAFAIETAYLVTGMTVDGQTTGRNVTGYYVNTAGMQVFVETNNAGTPTGKAFIPNQKIGETTTTKTTITPLPLMLNNKNVRELKPLEMRMFYPNSKEFTFRTAPVTLQWYFWDSDPKNWIMVGEARNPNEFSVEATVTFNVTISTYVGGAGQYGFETGRRYNPAGWDVSQEWGNGGSVDLLAPANRTGTYSVSDPILFRPGETKWFLIHGAETTRWAMGIAKDYILGSYGSQITKVIGADDTAFFRPWDMSNSSPSPYYGPSGNDGIINRINIEDCYGSLSNVRTDEDYFGGWHGTALYDWNTKTWQVEMVPNANINGDNGWWMIYATPEEIYNFYHGPRVQKANTLVSHFLNNWGLDVKYYYDPRGGLASYSDGVGSFSFRTLLPSNQYNGSQVYAGWRKALESYNYAMNLYGFAMYDWKQINPNTAPLGTPPATKYDFVVTNPVTKEGYLVAL